MRVLALAVAFLALSGGAAQAIDNAIPINDPVNGTDVAVRIGPQVQVNPPPPPPTVPLLWNTEAVNGHCVGFEWALSEFSPGWDVYRMSGIMYRESRCEPSASNSCCSGLLQIHRSWIGQLGECRVYSRMDLYDPMKNICAAAVVYREQGMSAWSTS
jgi:hypothetical protein